MKQYALTPEADEDLVAIWDYKAQHWGDRQASRYLKNIEQHCVRLANGELRGTPISNVRAIYSLRCEHHCIVYLDAQMPLVLAVLHEKMDIIGRVIARMSIK